MKPFEDANGEIFFYHKVEDEHFFMIGDNRDGSEDSRFWGSVPYKDIIGTPWFIYFSLNLKNSDEAKLGNKFIYKIRWERMFKGVEGLEKLATKKYNESMVDSLDSAIDSIDSTQDSASDFAQDSQDSAKDSHDLANKSKSTKD